MEKFDCDFSRICRACKKETDEMFSVFEPDAETGEPNKLAEMLMTCTTVLVESGDGLPSSICEPCATQLDNAFKFKKQCEITDASLRLYVRKKHIKEETNNTEETGDEVLDFASLYNSEISHIEDVKPEPTDLLEVISKESSMFPCDMCNKRFLTMRLLKSHKRVHSMSFKCKVCDEEFTRSNLLERHMRTHGSQKVHVCKICNKTLTKIEQLKRHMATHVKHKPFSCEKCKKCFSRVDHLANHAKRCKGGRPFVCNICNKGFMREDAMQLHVAGHGTNKAVLETIENYEDHYIQVENYPNSDMNEKTSDSDYFDEGGMNSNTDEKNNLTDTPIQATAVFKTEDLTQEEGAAEMNNHINSIADDSDDDAKPLSERVNQKQKSDDDVPMKRKRGRPRKSDSHCVVQKSKVGEFPCEQCGVIMSTQRRLELHIEKHSDGEAFECKICRKRFTRAIHLKRHFRNHADDKEFQCDLCSEIFDKRDDLIQHNTKEHPSDGMFECDVCSKVFNYFTNLENHKAQKHGEVDDKSPVFKKYKCQICEKAFTTEKYCETHMKSHSNERTWKCETCSKKFKTKSHLTEHTKFHSECARKYLCSECGQRFIRNDYLVIHMRRHRGEKPFKCKYCGKGFPRTTDLTVHERYHTGEKTHLCMVCGRGFGRAYNLTVHMRTHTGEKPYQCTYCDAAFAQGNDLKAHVRRHTGERYHCDLCPEAFLMGYLLTHHKRTVHGVDVRSHIRRLHPHEKVQPGAPPPTAPLLPLIASLPNVLPIPHALVQPEIKLEQPTAPMPMLSADS